MTFLSFILVSSLVQQLAQPVGEFNFTITTVYLKKKKKKLKWEEMKTTDSIRKY